MDKVILLYLVLILPVEADGFDLTLLHTNDIHSRFEEMNQFGGLCSVDEANEGSCYGGVARRYTKIQEIRNTGRNILLLDGGDQFQGTLWYSYYQGKAASYFNNLIGYNAATLGNHELNDGPQVLSQYLTNLTYPVVSCNLKSQNEPLLDKLYTASVVLDIGGEQIGVVGYITTKTKYLVHAEYLKNLVISNEIECLRAEVSKLTANGVNKIFALGYVEFAKNKDIAAQVNGIDVIVGGHDHIFLYTGIPPSNEEPVAEYPFLVTKPNGDQVYIVYDYAFGKYLGYLEISFDQYGVVISANGNPILLDNSVEQDQYILSEVEKWAAPLSVARNTTIAESYVELQGSGDTCRTDECNLGNLVTDALLYSQLLKAPAAGENWSQASVAVYNAGGIRASLQQGSVQLGNLMEVLPFRNEISGFNLRGKHVKQMLEHSVGRMAGIDPDVAFSLGSFLQMSGLRVKFDFTKAPGYRVQDVLIQCSQCTVPIYEPLIMEKKYGLVTSAFLLTGGDGYDVLSEHAEDVIPYGFTTMQAVRKYIETHTPIIHGVDGRIDFDTSNSNWPYPPKSSSIDDLHKGNSFIGVVSLIVICILHTATVRNC